jgi:4-aminobutyrate aminotransferase/(S)-3-amino-2-methylpropionate transaminase
MRSNLEPIPQQDDFLSRGDFVYRDLNAITISHSAGSSLYSSDKNRWIDLGAANGAALFGYDRDLVQRVGERWASIPFCPSSCETTHRLRYGEELGSFIASHLGRSGKVAFSVGGAGGIELALRAAAANRPSRRTVLVLQGGYHGRSLFLSHLSSSLRYRASGSSPGYNVVRLPVPAMLAKETGCSHTEAVRFCVSQMRAVFQNQTNGLRFGSDCDALAVVFEPLLNVAGMVDPDQEYVNQILSEAANVGCITIADEVFTGCFRTGAFLGSSAYDKCPDMVVLCKALTNGLTPMSVVWAVDDLLSRFHFPPGSYSSTHCNAPVHFHAASEVFALLKAVTVSSIKRIEGFLAELCQTVSSLGLSQVVNVGVRGMTAYMDFACDLDRDRVRNAVSIGVDGEESRVFFPQTSLSPSRLLIHPAITLRDDEMKCVFQCMESVCH